MRTFLSNMLKLFAGLLARLAWKLDGRSIVHQLQYPAEPPMELIIGAYGSQGRILGWVGAMRSGKSAAMLRHLNRLGFANIPFLLIKPSTCTRGNGTVEPRGMKPVPALVVEPHDLSAAWEKIRKMNSPPRVVAIDEVQFFDAEALQAFVVQLSLTGVEVVYAGLDRWAQGEFGEWCPATLSLMAVSSHYRHVNAVCMDCGHPHAVYSHRVGGEEQRVEVTKGDDDTVFRSICLACRVRRNGEKQAAA